MGRNEEELTAAGVPYEVGKARYREIARGQILGDDIADVKLLFHAETREILGVHIISVKAPPRTGPRRWSCALFRRQTRYLPSVRSLTFPAARAVFTKSPALDGMARLGL